jgi:hypothetical protein
MTEPERSPEDPEFQAGFVAASYAAGVRGENLLELFERRSARAETLGRALGNPSKSERARALATELQRLALMLEARRFR